MSFVTFVFQNTPFTSFVSFCDFCVSKKNLCFTRPILVVGTQMNFFTFAFSCILCFLIPVCMNEKFASPDWQPLFDDLLFDLRRKACVLLIGPEIVATGQQPLQQALRNALDRDHADDIEHYYEKEALFLFKGPAAKSKVQRGVSKFYDRATADPAVFDTIAAIPFPLVVSTNPDYFRAMGVPCRITTPEALRYEGGKLKDADGTVIDLIYKRVLLHELIAEGGLEHPMVRAVADGAVCMVNPFACKPLHKKASLAVLSDERNAGRFSGAEQAAIATHIPWTRVVEERKTVIDGTAIDLLPWMLRERESLVLKPNDDWGDHSLRCKRNTSKPIR